MAVTSHGVLGLTPTARFVVSASSSVVNSPPRVSLKRFYWNITGFPFPLGPFLERATVRKEVVKGKIWTFEQEQALGFSSVSTNIRMTIVKLQSGGLWVHAPVAPTRECIQLLRQLGSPVEYIVLPTFAYEHKVYVGPFSRNFPRAQVWVAPRQWSWPLNLPLEFLGIFFAKTLPQDASAVPWSDELEHKILSAPELGIGPYIEVAFYHKKTNTLLVTDAVIYVPDTAPEVISKDTLLGSAKNGLAVKVLSKNKPVPRADYVPDTRENRQKGWERMVLLILFLGPSNLLEPEASFAQVSKRLIVSPIVKTLVFSKVPDKVKFWVDSIAEDWKFRRIIPAHFAAPVSAGPRTFKAAFAFLDELLEQEQEPSILTRLLDWTRSAGSSVFSPEDMKTLSSLDSLLVSLGAVKKTKAGRRRG